MTTSPLADRLRPQKLSEFVGQEHLVGKDGIITKLLAPRSPKGEVGFPSLIFWGPPGSGKTTLARIIARDLKRDYHEFSAVTSSIKEIEQIMKLPSVSADVSFSAGFVGSEIPPKQESLLRRRMKDSSLFPPIVVIDEIHRFNKAQQAKLLPFVETGAITLVGATTENPSFEVIGPLLSRSRVIILNQLSNKELKRIVSRGLKEIKRKIDKRAEDFLIESSNGDARILLNTLEIASQITSHKTLNTKHLSDALQKSQLTFDKKGEEYFNVISAFIKSMRASDVDAALYYLARMVAAGQDPLYIARRMVVFASEDIGMAQPTAIVIANEVFRACETIGYPECQENLAHGVVYLSLAKKDRGAYNAYMEALGDAQKFGNLSVPMKIRNPVTKLMEEVGYGKGYDLTAQAGKYTKDSLLPEKLKGKKYYLKHE